MKGIFISIWGGIFISIWGGIFRNSDWYRIWNRGYDYDLYGGWRS